MSKAQKYFINTDSIFTSLLLTGKLEASLDHPELISEIKGAVLIDPVPNPTHFTTYTCSLSEIYFSIHGNWEKKSNAIDAVADSLSTIFGTDKPLVFKPTKKPITEKAGLFIFEKINEHKIYWFFPNPVLFMYLAKITGINASSMDTEKLAAFINTHLDRYAFGYRRMYPFSLNELFRSATAAEREGFDWKHATILEIIENEQQVQSNMNHLYHWLRQNKYISSRIIEALGRAIPTGPYLARRFLTPIPFTPSTFFERRGTKPPKPTNRFTVDLQSGSSRVSSIFSSLMESEQRVFERNEAERTALHGTPITITKDWKAQTYNQLIRALHLYVMKFTDRADFDEQFYDHYFYNIQELQKAREQEVVLIPILQRNNLLLNKVQLHIYRKVLQKKPYHNWLDHWFHYNKLFDFYHYDNAIRYTSFYDKNPLDFKVLQKSLSKRSIQDLEDHLEYTKNITYSACIAAKIKTIKTYLKDVFNAQFNQLVPDPEPWISLLQIKADTIYATAQSGLEGVALGTRFIQPDIKTTFLNNNTRLARDYIQYIHNFDLFTNPTNAPNGAVLSKREYDQKIDYQLRHEYAIHKKAVYQLAQNLFVMFSIGELDLEIAPTQSDTNEHPDIP